MAAQTHAPRAKRDSDPRRPPHQAGRAAWYRLRCPSASCPSALAKEASEAARLVREHPAVCPDPGRRIPGSTVYPSVFAERVAQ